MRCATRGVGPITFAVMLMVAQRGLSAHEIGTTRVAISLPGDGTFHVEVVTDAQTLADRLVAATRGKVNPRWTTDQDRLVDLARVFASGVTIRADEVPLRHDVSVRVREADQPGGSPMAVMVLDGRLSAGARQVDWQYAWTSASYALSMETPGHPRTTVWLEGGQVSPPIALVTAPRSPSQLDVASQYLRLGYTHILPGGLDHVLFVLGLFLLGRGKSAGRGGVGVRGSAVFLQVTTFTVAHSITLALGLLGIVVVSPRVVEPLIALSIAYVALENLLVPSLTWRRLALVFAFGLLHGLGFASALADLGLPRRAFAAALVSFNAGVELGQLTVVAFAFAALGAWWADRTWYRRRVVVPASCAIAAVAAFWTVERLLS